TQTTWQSKRRLCHMWTKVDSVCSRHLFETIDDCSGLNLEPDLLPAGECSEMREERDLVSLLLVEIFALNPERRKRRYTYLIRHVPAKYDGSLVAIGSENWQSLSTHMKAIWR